MNGGAVALEIARRRLLDPAGTSEELVARSVAELRAAGDGIADLYFQASKRRQWTLEDGAVSRGGFAIEQGVGARTVSGGRTAFAHSADLRPEALRHTVHAAREMLSAGRDATETGGMSLTPRGKGHDLYPPLDAVDAVPAATAIALLEEIDRQARQEPLVTRVSANLAAREDVILIAADDGRLVADVRPFTRLSVSVVAARGGRSATGQAGIGGRCDATAFDARAIEKLVEQAVTMAVTNLDAIPAPAGAMSVVLGPGYPGVLFHEAVGHGLEGDFHRKGISAFTGMTGARVAAPGVTVVDDGGLPGRPGSLGVDDEGTPAERTVLIEDGILVGMMQDRMNASQMNARSTGNGRRQSYAHLPMPRMTNTFLENGRADPSEIVRSVKRGIYADAFGGGQVDIISGRFNFSATAAWLIEDGRLTVPLEGVTLIGTGRETLRHIHAVGNDLQLDEGIATCGKQGQQINVSVGQPTLRIDNVMVGGRG